MTTFVSYTTLTIFITSPMLLFVQQCNGIRDRSKAVELWSAVAQYCLLVGNYNSATVILESLESPAIARLQTTVSKILKHNIGHYIAANIIIKNTLIRYVFVPYNTFHKICCADYCVHYLLKGR